MKETVSLDSRFACFKTEKHINFKENFYGTVWYFTRVDTHAETEASTCANDHIGEQWREKVYTPWYKAMPKPEPPKRKPVEITKPLQSGDVSEFNIGKNVSAAARTDSVRIPSKLSGLSKDIYVMLSQGQKVRGVKIAGRGTGKPIHSELESLREQFPNIDAADWAKYAGNAYVDDMGMKRKAHIHWYEAKDGIRSRMKVVKFHS